MYPLLKKNRWFFIPYIIVGVFCLFIVLSYPKSSVHLFLNSINSAPLDYFFKYLTILGDGLIIPFLIIILIFIRFRDAFFLLLVYIVSGLFTQLLKRTIFSQVPRPTKYFEEIAQLHLVKDVDLLSMKSFPSGHSTTAFAIMICFVLFSKNDYLKLLFFILAALIAYSRVYLSQHFLHDILAGSFIGVLTGLVLFRIVQNLKWKWLDKNILTIKN